MTPNVYEWAMNALQTIYLWNDVYERIDPRTNAKITKNVERERKLAISLINCSTPEDFYTCARQICPVGTVIEPFENSPWATLFDEKTKLVFVELTKGLLDERFCKSAKVLIDILSKRLETWKDKNKEVSVKTIHDEGGLNVTFTVG